MVQTTSYDLWFINDLQFLNKHFSFIFVKNIGWSLFVNHWLTIHNARYKKYMIIWSNRLIQCAATYIKIKTIKLWFPLYLPIKNWTNTLSYNALNLQLEIRCVCQQPYKNKKAITYFFTIIIIGKGNVDYLVLWANSQTSLKITIQLFFKLSITAISITLLFIFLFYMPISLALFEKHPTARWVLMPVKKQIYVSDCIQNVSCLFPSSKMSTQL